MEIFITDKLMNLLMISVTFSIFLMALIQKIKKLSLINKDWHIWIINLILSFVLGYFFSSYFFKIDLIDSIWVSLFSFIGAPSIYQILKKQTIINYTPLSLNSSEEFIKVPLENEIRRDYENIREQKGDNTKF